MSAPERPTPATSSDVGSIPRSWFTRYPGPVGLALRYGLAVAAIVAAYGLRVALTALLGPGLPPFVTFYPFMMIVALVAGLGPGLLATGMGVLIAAGWAIAPRHDHWIDWPIEGAALLIFSFTGVFLSYLADLFHRNREKAAEYDRQQTLLPLQREKELLAGWLENVDQPFAVGYPDGRVGRVNRAFERLTGYSAVELAALDWSTTLTPPAWRDLERQQLAELQRTGQPVRYRKQCVRKDGVRLDVEIFAHLVRNADGQPDYYYSFVTDITQLRQAEERGGLLAAVTAELLASPRPQEIIESLCRRVMAQVDCQVFFNFLVDEPSGRLHLNACGGVTPETAREIEWLESGTAVCGCVARDGERIIAGHIQSSADSRTELVRSLGMRAYACHPLMNQGQVVGTLSFGSTTRDVFSDDQLELMQTIANHVAIALQRLRLMESLQQHARAAEAANEAKSRFLANMSHELRTPMNAILGMVDVALPDAVDPRVLDCLETVKQSASVLLALVNDLLDSAKIESGKLELEATPFSLRQTLEQLTRTLAVQAREKGLAFHCQIADDAPDGVIGDRTRLQQVLYNLAGNALKFTERGEVEIALRVVNGESGMGDGELEDADRAVDGETDSSDPQAPIPDPSSVTLEFAVRDTGIGIPAAGLERIFEPFTQADASTTRRFGGTGLGLSISKRLVELMGGRIVAQSKLGAGSTFRFRVCLPLAPELVSPDASAARAAPAALAPLRILLAEDNPANQKLASYILRDRGHAIDIAGDGQEAVEMSARNPYDVILMDVQMPEMDGLEATALIRRREAAGTCWPAGRVPIIAMTAHAMKGDRDRCLAAGMDGYLAKPLNAQELSGLLEGIVQTRADAERRGVAAGEFASATGPAAPASVPPAAPPVFDPGEALAHCFHIDDMVHEMIQCFFDETRRLLPKMRAALALGDLTEIGRLGHRLKGTVVYLGAGRAKEAAQHVECFSHGGRGTVTEAAAAVAALERECAALEAALAEYRRAAPAGSP